jgi:N-acetylglucosamine malate deacetylase 1
MKLDILAFAAHPDDIELAASGTVMAHIVLGKKVGIIDLTQGELGSRGSAEIRMKEVEVSNKILGVHVRENLKFRDGFFVKDESHLLKVIEMIRKYQPEIILANAVSDRHIDHGKAADLINDACFLSGLVKIETCYNGESQNVWRPKAVYHYIQDYYLNPDIVVDITPYFEKKMESIKAFSSQFYNPKSIEPQTPISSKDFLNFIESRCVQFGRTINVKYGEGFTVKRAMGTKDLSSIL